MAWNVKIAPSAIARLGDFRSETRKRLLRRVEEDLSANPLVGATGSGPLSGHRFYEVRFREDADIYLVRIAYTVNEQAQEVGITSLALLNTTRRR